MGDGGWSCLVMLSVNEYRNSNENEEFKSNHLKNATGLDCHATHTIGECLVLQSTCSRMGLDIE